MTVDMTNNRVPYGLLTDEEKAALHEHEKAGGVFKVSYESHLVWTIIPKPTWKSFNIYRTVPLPKAQDVIAWDRLPDWVEWVARDDNGEVHVYDKSNPHLEGKNTQGEDVQWLTFGHYRRIDDFPGIVQIGTCDWRDSKQRRPKVRE
jgi:hypothetical protein